MFYICLREGEILCQFTLGQESKDDSLNSTIVQILFLNKSCESVNNKIERKKTLLYSFHSTPSENLIKILDELKENSRSTLEAIFYICQAPFILN